MEPHPSAVLPAGHGSRRQIRRHADLAKQTDAGATALAYAAFMDHGPVVEYLLRRGSTTRGALHALMPGFSGGGRGTTSSTRIAAMLLAHGADPNGLDSTKQTPLQAYLSVDPGFWNLALIGQVIEAGARVDVRVKSPGSKPKSVRAISPPVARQEQLHWRA